MIAGDVVWQWIVVAGSSIFPLALSYLLVVTKGLPLGIRTIIFEIMVA